MDRPLVSIFTPTWNRHKEVLATVDNVLGQTYPNIEHLIVSDGPDTELFVEVWRKHIPLHKAPKVITLGRRWTEIISGSFAVAPLMVGALMSKGKYHMWLCDDEEMHPQHVEKLVNLIEETGVDFVYPRALLYKNGSEPKDGWIVGTDPPSYGEFTSCLYRAEALDKAMYRFKIPAPPGVHDWDMVMQWKASGATWRMLPDITLTHKVDH